MNEYTLIPQSVFILIIGILSSNAILLASIAKDIYYTDTMLASISITLAMANIISGLILVKHNDDNTVE